MKLRNNLYTVAGSDPADPGFHVRFIPDCVIYKAHFPGMPVTPGVCIIGIAHELYESLTGSALRLVEVVNAKFLSVINPLVTPEVDYSIGKTVADDDEGTVKVAFTVKDSSTTYAKLSLLFKKA